MNNALYNQIRIFQSIAREGNISAAARKLEITPPSVSNALKLLEEYIGHPLFNDERYGGDRILKGTTFAKYKQFIDNCFSVMPRHALHARSLGFEHPSTRRRMEFDSELPADFRAVLDKWDAYTAARPAEEE